MAVSNIVLTAADVPDPDPDVIVVVPTDDLRNSVASYGVLGDT